MVDVEHSLALVGVFGVIILIISAFLITSGGLIIDNPDEFIINLIVTVIAVSGVIMFAQYKHWWRF